jgi:hypothetical protein
LHPRQSPVGSADFGRGRVRGRLSINDDTTQKQLLLYSLGIC